MKETLLIIDLGTTSIKAVAFDLVGKPVFDCFHPTPFNYDHDIMEIEPGALWNAVKHVCQKTRTAIGNTIAAISMSSMAASFIPLDAGGKPLHPGIGWADGRSIGAMSESMDKFLRGERVPRCGQYPLQMYLPYKIRWFAKNRPDVFRRAARWVNVSEYVYAQLTGEQTWYTDFSIASRTMLFDVENRCWNKEALELYEIEERALPQPVRAGTVIGTVGRELRDIGYDATTPIVMGGHDHMCSLPGAAVFTPGGILNTTGTSEAIVALAPPGQACPEDIAAQWVNVESGVLPDTIALVGYVGASGRVFQSLRESVGENNAANDVPLGEIPIFLPPQRAQLTSVTGELRGLYPAFSPAILYRAVCDGLYLECRRMLERITNIRGGAACIAVAGGHVKNIVEMKRKSAALGIPLSLVCQTNVSAKGAAVLAGTGCGLFASSEEAIASLCGGDIMQHIEPDRHLAEQFEDMYRTRYLPCFEKGLSSL